MTSDNTLETAAALQPTATKKQIRLNIVSATTGTALEYFDFALYGLASALVFNQLFFPNLDPATGFLASFATFGVGFFARAAGGVVLGYFGDRLGRKLVLMITIGLMGISTAMIGMLPTYDQVGLLAPILLVVLRLTPTMPIQPFAAGLEVPQGSGLDRWTRWTPFTYPFNMTQQPALSLPCGLSPQGLPVGLQIVGPRFGDDIVLRAGRAFEKLKGGFKEIASLSNPALEQMQAHGT